MRGHCCGGGGGGGRKRGKGVIDADVEALDALAVALARGAPEAARRDLLAALRGGRVRGVGRAFAGWGLRGGWSVVFLVGGCGCVCVGGGRGGERVGPAKREVERIRGEAVGGEDAPAACGGVAAAGPAEGEERGEGARGERGWLESVARRGLGEGLGHGIEDYFAQAAAFYPDSLAEAGCGGDVGEGGAVREDEEDGFGAVAAAAAAVRCDEGVVEGFFGAVGRVVDVDAEEGEGHGVDAGEVVVRFNQGRHFMHEVEEEGLRVEAGKMVCGVVGLQALAPPL